SFAELFALLFSSLKPSLPSLIPAPSSLPSPSSSLSTDPFEHSLIASFGLSSTTSSSSSKNNSSASSKLHLYADETMVWQFLASLAIVANIDQQHHLVSLTRLSITSRIRLAQSDPQLAPLLLHNVNLFLNALGLDASQLSSL
ncbi:DNA topoisomerase 2-associated protein pat1, partial [Zancudomyces culisetae]